MFSQATRVAEKLRRAQEQVAQLTQHMLVLMSLREGDQVRAEFEFGGRVLTRVGVVRVLTNSSFFLELETGALLMVDEALQLEILSSVDDRLMGVALPETK